MSAVKRENEFLHFLHHPIHTADPTTRLFVVLFYHIVIPHSLCKLLSLSLSTFIFLLSFSLSLPELRINCNRISSSFSHPFVVDVCTRHRSTFTFCETIYIFRNSFQSVLALDADLFDRTRAYFIAINSCRASTMVLICQIVRHLFARCICFA